ncbi:MAG TPA: fumarylacetoacetate hydrolase family protein [Gammaproteobacteria bacterium]|nr:fumarylacetoacetate hydrolase family protein [Gammaproteobacteria bacterium]
MKLATLKEGGRDGTLVVVDRELQHYAAVPEIAPTLQDAVERWDETEGLLRAVYEDLNQRKARGARPLQPEMLASPLPRAYQFLDGSAYLAHVERVRKARNAEMPPSFQEDPLMYQAVSDGFLAPTEPVRVASTDYGIDFESEIGVITGDIPQGAVADECGKHIRLVVLINDVSLRNLIPAELKKNFGFLQSKPRSALSPVAVTPDELGDAWRGGKLHLPLITHLNGKLFGEPNAGDDMQFSFPQLLAHAAKTRPLSAGTLLGSGTIANQDITRGSSCLAERRMLEIIDSGEATTQFMQYGDRVRIEMNYGDGRSIFGAIDQTIEPYSL